MEMYVVINLLAKPLLFQRLRQQLLLIRIKVKQVKWKEEKPWLFLVSVVKEVCYYCLSLLFLKVHNAANSNQKEKYEADLKKEIKKLQVRFFFLVLLCIC